jgi:hypothetical protein
MVACPKKHIISWLLMPLPYIPMLVVLALLGSQLAVQMRMREKLQSESLLTVKLSRNALVWIEDGRELSIDGRLFDVFTIENDGETVMVSGLFDEQETNIRLQLDKILHNQQNNTEQQNLLYRILVNITWESEVQDILLQKPSIPIMELSHQWKEGDPKPPNGTNPFIPPDRC